MTKTIYEEIERLQRKANIIEFAETIVKYEGNLFKTAISSKCVDKDAKNYVTSAIKEFLINFIQSVENNIDYSKIFSLCAEDISKLKLLLERMKNLSSEVSSAEGPKVIDASAVQSEPKLNPVEIQAKPQQQIPQNPVKNARALILDTTYITDIHGALQNIYPDMEIMILSEKGSDYFNACLIDRPNVRFDVPRDCVEIK